MTAPVEVPAAMSKISRHGRPSLDSSRTRQARGIMPRTPPPSTERIVRIPSHVANSVPHLWLRLGRFFDCGSSHVLLALAGTCAIGAPGGAKPGLAGASGHRAWHPGGDWAQGR